ncbi:Transcriptional regulator [Giardia muris]|uniref:Transcriptional regulator n=1 Tax=Giardia muris TaxID=5742 RepID=A0A4Z1SU53_GIAMU|nr:Transcriptional regulator [Giardia muris]|eukprot:TNJ29442.1 Transcriptional regulator [Giardia muris]
MQGTSGLMGTLDEITKRQEDLHSFVARVTSRLTILREKLEQCSGLENTDSDNVKGTLQQISTYIDKNILETNDLVGFVHTLEETALETIPLEHQEAIKDRLSHISSECYVIIEGLLTAKEIGEGVREMLKQVLSITQSSTTDISLSINVSDMSQTDFKKLEQQPETMRKVHFTENLSMGSLTSITDSSIPKRQANTIQAKLQKFINARVPPQPTSRPAPTQVSPPRPSGDGSTIEEDYDFSADELCHPSRHTSPLEPQKSPEQPSMLGSSFRPDVISSTLQLGDQKEKTPERSASSLMRATCKVINTQYNDLPATPARAGSTGVARKIVLIDQQPASSEVPSPLLQNTSTPVKRLAAKQGQRVRERTIPTVMADRSPNLHGSTSPSPQQVLEALHLRNEEQKGDIRQLRQEVARLQAQLNSVKEDYQKQENEVVETLELYQRAQSQYDREIAECHKDLDEQKGLCSALEDAIRELQQENSELKATRERPRINDEVDGEPDFYSVPYEVFITLSTEYASGISLGSISTAEFYLLAGAQEKELSTARQQITELTSKLEAYKHMFETLTK